MKKIASAALAATMTVSLAAAPTAGAASNTMTPEGNCIVERDDAVDLGYIDYLGQDFNPQMAAWQNYAEPFPAGSAIASSRWGEALGSSDEYQIRYADNLQAVQACANSENFESKRVEGAEKAGIIIGTVLLAIAGVAAVAAPFMLPQIQKYLPF